MRLARIKCYSLQLTLPAFLGLSILFGGSSIAELNSRAWLSLASVIVLFVALPFAVRRDLNRATLAGSILFVAWLAWTLAQLIPLPAFVWQKLGDRSVVEHGMELLRMAPTTTMPVSLSPHKTWLSVTGIMPAVAAFVLIISLGWRYAVARLNWAIPIFGTVSALLGLGQILGGGSDQLYFYEVTNLGLPVGFFANVNHQACFLLMCLPFVAALIGRLRRDWASGDDDVARAMVLAAMTGLILVGVLATGSVAGYVIMLPVLFLSLLLVRKPEASKRPHVASPAILIVSTLAAVLLVAFSPLLDGLGVTSFEASGMSRLGIWEVSREIAGDHWSVGTGLGSFADVYQLYENPGTVTTIYANHAHNDYLEAFIEFGLPGTLVLVAAVALILTLFVRVWTKQSIENRRLKRAASTAVLVVLLHSFVDYPVRTPAIACLFAVCFAILVMDSGSQSRRRTKSTKRPDFSSQEGDRHLVI
jgi:O-antigen ligase